MTLLCAEDGQTPATHSCSVCNVVLCTACDAAVHRLHIFAHHLRTLLPASTPDTSHVLLSQDESISERPQSPLSRRQVSIRILEDDENGLLSDDDEISARARVPLASSNAAIEVLDSDIAAEDFDEDSLPMDSDMIMAMEECMNELEQAPGSQGADALPAASASALTGVETVSASLSPPARLSTFATVPPDIPPPTAQHSEKLRKVFGHVVFKPLQWAIIHSVMIERKVG